MERDLKTVLWQKVENFIKNNVDTVLEKMAKEKRHEVVYSPPYNSDLNPIEIIWAIVKTQVGRQYDTTSNFKKVLEKLQKAFSTLNSQTIDGCIRKCNNIVCKLFTEIENKDEETELTADEDSDDL
ncbi:hypothetical protein A3Q56_08514 [Intoshia linei]|uniref:Tc1-like transposase DDE domain-containing protein n=1 Tax=Intoshia linei TaxID=1819745 RepID=A0A177AQV2_9BILA|nr:hypothetical protein A3Q56_08514 [Intoshia linei]